jgi:hypothetical protein
VNGRHETRDHVEREEANDHRSGQALRIPAFSWTARAPMAQLEQIMP